MKKIILFILFLSVTKITLSQQSDFIVLKKRNNRTLKTYYPGEFISAVTYSGFPVNGFIKDIRNDSIILLQQERRLVAAGFGSELDTVSYILAIDYRDIKSFHYTSQYTWGRKRGFAQITVPKLMMAGGAGYIILELVNTAYRNESINANNKLASLGIAAAIAATGFAITQFQKHRDKAGGKYKVVYVKNSK